MTFILKMFDPSSKKGTPHNYRSDRTVDPGKMIYVPGGHHVVGSQGPYFTYDNERPVTSVFTDGFWIDVVPVTNAIYRGFVEEGGYRRKELWNDEGWEWKKENGIECPRYWRMTDGIIIEQTMFDIGPLREDAPVTGISWYEAEACARFLGKRLPTELEWDKAACWDVKADRARRFPWGDEFSDRNANFGRKFWEETPVGMFPEGASPYGCLDMAGNLWEWTLSTFSAYPGFKWFPYQEYSEPFFDGAHYVLRGGSWATQGPLLRSSFRNWYRPELREILAGFRCVRSGNSQR
jgi:iron(II)-dependent oxidoreductase